MENFKHIQKWTQLITISMYHRPVWYLATHGQSCFCWTSNHCPRQYYFKANLRLHTMSCIKVLLHTVSLKEKILPYLKQTHFHTQKFTINNYPLISIILSSNYQWSHKFDSVSSPLLLVFCTRPPSLPGVSGSFWRSSTSGPLYWLFTQPGKPTPRLVTWLSSPQAAAQTSQWLQGREAR